MNPGELSIPRQLVGRRSDTPNALARRSSARGSRAAKRVTRARCSVADPTHQDAAIQIEAILGNGPRNTHAQARQREGRTREVEAPSLAFEIIVGGDTDAGVQVEALVRGGYVGISPGF